MAWIPRSNAGHDEQSNDSLHDFVLRWNTRWNTLRSHVMLVAYCLNLALEGERLERELE